MNIQYERTVELGIAVEEILERMECWAEYTGFDFIQAGPPLWRYRRGSSWHALYSMNVRKTPTAVVVELLPGDPRRVRCAIHCKSWLQVATPSDGEVLLDDLELLLRCLCERELSLLRTAPKNPTR